MYNGQNKTTHVSYSACSRKYPSTVSNPWGKCTPLPGQRGENLLVCIKTHKLGSLSIFVLVLLYDSLSHNGNRIFETRLVPSLSECKRKTFPVRPSSHLSPNLRPAICCIDNLCSPVLSLTSDDNRQLYLYPIRKCFHLRHSEEF